MKRTNRRGRRGFSLVELLAVVLILAVLAGVAVPVYLNQRTRAANRACQGNVATISKAASLYLLNTGAYPATVAAMIGAQEGGLGATPTCPLAAGTYSVTPDAGPPATIEIECTSHAGNAVTLTAPIQNSNL
jgi:prepilin-type N-terminal cleavage/methylation domain-containing protein